MKKLLLLLLPLVIASCAGIKVQKGAPVPQPTSKPGVTWGGSILSGGGVQLGYWCEVKGTLLSFGASGPSEEKATEIARESCHRTYPNHACPLVSCKPN